MVRSGLLLSFGVLVLSACGTPQQQCISRSTGEYRKVDSLIARTEANLARGYGYEEQTIVTQEWDTCFGGGGWGGGDGWGRPYGFANMCLEPQERTIRRPVTIDPQVEERKLAFLKKRRAELAASANAAIASCKASYPEG